MPGGPEWFLIGPLQAHMTGHTHCSCLNWNFPTNGVKQCSFANPIPTDDRRTAPFCDGKGKVLDNRFSAYLIDRLLTTNRVSGGLSAVPNFSC